MPMPRILLLNTDLELGGTPFVVRELARRLNHIEGVTVEVACLSPWGPVAGQLRQMGVAVHALDAQGPGDLPRALIQLVRLIRRQHFDTVFSFLMHANTTAALASLFVEDVRFIQAIQTTQRTPRWHWWMQRFAQYAADAIVVPSESVAHGATEWAHIPANKIVVIPNAIDASQWPRSTAIAEQSPVPIGFIGRLDPIKRVGHLLEALPTAQELLGRPIHLHIFGEGADRPAIEAKIASLRLADQVTLHGAVTDVPAAFGTIALLVLPSLAEGFPLVLIEAMAAGVPIVATRVPGIVDAIDEGKTGLLVDPHSTANLAKAIATILCDDTLRAGLIDNGLAKVKECYSWETILPRYLQLLRWSG
jgi:glycosyltransferase involved in cell wall biosynthesis